MIFRYKNDIVRGIVYIDNNILVMEVSKTDALPHLSL
jgi:hypothetical protein